MSREFSTDKIDINDSESNVTRQELTIEQMKEEDIIKGICTERQHEIWLRVKKLSWTYREAAEFFECGEDNIKWHLKEIKKKVKTFRVNVRTRGGYFFS